jgi:hypothetical protein
VTTRCVILALGNLLLAGCSSAPPREPPVDPDLARAEIRERIPATVANRDAWAIDTFAAFEALEVRPTARNICAVVAVIQQESGFQVDPVVPGFRPWRVGKSMSAPGVITSRMLS